MTPLLAVLSIAWSDLVTAIGATFAGAAIFQAIWALRAAYESRRSAEKLVELRGQYAHIEYLLDHVDSLEADQVARLLAKAKDVERLDEAERLRATPSGPPEADKAT